MKMLKLFVHSIHSLLESGVDDNDCNDLDNESKMFSIDMKLGEELSSSFPIRLD